MSYDYDGLVSEITASRSLARETETAIEAMDSADNSLDEYAIKELELLEHLSTSVDKFEALSKHCPMTPLLWMQYALDTFELMKIIKKQEDPQAFEGTKNHAFVELVETRIQLLELGMHEFPGSAILRLHHDEMVLVAEMIQQQQLKSGQSAPPQRLPKVLKDSIDALGRGSHRNESRLVVEFYKHLCNDAIASLGGDALGDELSRIYLQRAETPMNDGLNAGLGEQYAEKAGKAAKSSTLAEIENLRRFEARHYGFLVTYEDDIDVAFQTETGTSIKAGIETWEDGIVEFETRVEDVHLILKKWKGILSKESSCWMGLGGPHTANAFVKYAQACYRYRSPKHYEETDAQKANTLEEKIQKMAVSVFERGLAECPTVDSLWLSYLRRLNYLIDQQTPEQKAEKIALLTKASSVVDRAIRNCPYSTELVKAKLKLFLAMANEGMVVLDPEELLTTTIVKDCLDNGFVQPEGESCSPSLAVELFQTLVSVVRSRILVVLAEATQTKTTSKNGKKSTTTILKYDEPESIQLVMNKDQASMNGGAISEVDLQDLEDLCSDMREIFDEADSYLRKNNKRYRVENNNDSITITVEEARFVLAKERATMESQLVAPLLRTINETNRISKEVQSRDKEELAELLQHHAKATKIWQPPHPGTYMAYIETFSASSSAASSTICSPTDILRNLRIIRFLYQKALKSVGNPRKTNKKNQQPPSETNTSNPLSPDELDYETSLRCLCRNYLLFEKYFGSDHSYSECQKAVQKKLSKAFAMAADPATSVAKSGAGAVAPMAVEAENNHTSTDASNQKRKRSNETEVPPAKRQKEEAEKQAPPKKATNFRELEEQRGRKFPEYKVKVGKIEHPAHPFTVKVSFLSPQTEDMDLVDILRPKCGPIVHAKVMRDKHSHRSKGWALVQFEERDSVETALGLSDVLGIKGKSVIIERSHLPAIGLVAVHRVNPQGEGRSTKRNMRNKQRALEQKGDHGEKKVQPKTKSTKPAGSKPSATSSTAGIFAFRPRGVTAGGSSQQRKTKISFAPTAAVAETKKKKEDSKEPEK